MQNIFRIVVLGLLFTLIGGIVWGQEWKTYSPGSVWVLEGGQGIKFHPNGKIELLKLITPNAFANGASLYFPKYDKYVYTQPYDSVLFMVLERDSFGHQKIEVKMKFGVNIRDQNNKIISGGDSLFGYLSRTNGSIFLPISDTTAYFFSIGTPYNYFHDTIITGQKPPVILDDVRQFIKPRIYATKILCTSTDIRVTERQTMLTDVDVVNKMGACKHADGVRWWLLSHERNASNGFLRFLVSEDGIKQYPTQYMGRIHCPAYFDSNWVDYKPRINFGDLGEISFNKQGNKLASVAPASTPNDSSWDIVDLFDFDRCTGMLSNYSDLKTYRSLGNFNFYVSCHFSENGNNLFLGSPKYYWYPPRLSVVGLRREIVRGDKDTFWISNTFPNFKKSVYDSTLLFIELFPNELRQIQNGDLTLADESLSPDYHYKNKIGLGFSTKLKLGSEQILGFLPNTANYLLPPLPYDFNVDRHPVAYRDTLCMYDSTSLGGWYPAGKHLHRWSPSAGLSSDTAFRVTFRPPVVNINDTVYTFILHTEGRVGGCLEGQSRQDTFNVFVYGNGRGGCRTVSRLDAIPPQIIQIYPNPTNGTLYIKSSWERMDKVMLFTMEGKLVFERNLSDTQAELFVGDLSDGVYLCKITTTEGIFTQKVVIKK